MEPPVPPRETPTYDPQPLSPPPNDPDDGREPPPVGRISTPDEPEVCTKTPPTPRDPDSEA